MQLPINSVLKFLNDEGLDHPIKIDKDDDYDYQIQINEPFVSDTRLRCGITGSVTFAKLDGKKHTAFKCFKSVGNYGGEYQGSFFKFVKLVKNFSGVKEAKFYFLKNYLNIETLFNPPSSFEKKKEEKNINLELPSNSEIFNKEKHEEYYRYLLNRGLSDDKIAKIKIFIQRDERRIIFPIYEYGNLVFYAKRAIDKNPMPWSNIKAQNVYPIYNFDNVGYTVEIFEGIFDSLKRKNGIALLGLGNMSQMQKILQQNFYKIILVMDNDIYGHKAKLSWAKYLTRKGHDNVYIFDYSGIDKKDFGELENFTEKEFLQRVYYYNDLKTKMRFKSLIKGGD